MVERWGVDCHVLDGELTFANEGTGLETTAVLAQMVVAHREIRLFFFNDTSPTQSYEVSCRVRAKDSLHRS